VFELVSHRKVRCRACGYSIEAGERYNRYEVARAEDLTIDWCEHETCPADEDERGRET